MYIYWKPWYISILDMHIYNNAYGGNGGGGGGMCSRDTCDSLHIKKNCKRSFYR